MFTALILSPLSYKDWNQQSLSNSVVIITASLVRVSITISHFGVGAIQIGLGLASWGP